MNEALVKRFLNLSVVLRLVSAVLLIWALSKHKYDYYTILRWVVSATSVYCGTIANKMKNSIWVAMFAPVAILFNPIIPIGLSRNTWSKIDVACAIFLLVSIKFVNEPSVTP